MLDLSHLTQLFRGDRSQVRDWIELYLQEAPVYFEQLSASIESGDVHAMATAAHDLQPQAHYLGSQRMLELLVAIEDRALAEGPAACGDLVSALHQLRETIDPELRAVLNAS